MSEQTIPQSAVVKAPQYRLGQRVRSSDELYFQVQDFLFDEIDLLDGDRLSEWLELLDENIFYHAPVRITTLRSKGHQFDDTMNWFHETKASLGFKVKRFEQTGSGWAGDPAPRVRRLLSNLIVHSTSVDELVHATTNILLSISRGNEHGVDIITAKRRDLLKKNAEGMRIFNRKIYLDHTILGVPSLSFFI
jgi:phthalate 3,4-dioxygenase subunit beta